MVSTLRITAARILKGGIQYARGVRGRRRTVIALAFACACVILLYNSDSRRQQEDANAEPRGSQHLLSTVGSWWQSVNYPGSDNAATGSAAAAADHEYSVKPIAYVFPQFHAIPENDEFWGVNFTEWTNVRKVTKNAWGIEVQQPTDEVGYYNLLDYSTRWRYAQHARDSGLYGFVYHHYWFGRPVMEKVLTAMLEDGQPDMPFMLSWANEPWTARWDGNDNSKVLLKQTYGGVDAWREHFEWLLPFFRHPNQIRVNGKVQFAVYNGGHMGDVGKRMYSAWRKWAVDEGLGGLDIIETRIAPDNPEDRGLTDAVNEFGFRSGGAHDGTAWASINRLGRVYHRGAAVSWDNTPRHAQDGGASANIFAHPSLWKFHILNLIRRIKLDPNPRGEENFLFINAFNEWGEGNVLEPSRQWGSGFSAALRSAVALSHTLPWKDELIAQAEALARRHAIATSPAPATPHPHRHDIDVCVVVRTFASDWQFSEPFGLSDLLRSLGGQTNPRWRAVVVRGSAAADARIVKSHVLDAYDPRVAFVDDDVPREVLTQGANAAGDAAEWAVADWVLARLGELAAQGLTDCGLARYVVVAKSNDTYVPGAFEAVAAPDSGDIVGLSFETADTLRAVEEDENGAVSTNGSSGGIPWHERCTRLREERVAVCVPAAPATSPSLLEPGAVLINLAKLTAGGHTSFGSKGAAGSLQDLVGAGWSWTAAAPPPENSTTATACQLVQSGSYRSCIQSGRFWLDVPSASPRYAAGCYSLSGITGRHGFDTSQWDMEGWRADPFCLRLSEKAYAE
ncbi:glycosyltransferase WbsX-domain-containing protein [Lasiosphaeria ovina]|uniref:Glycosyltransferase WbsX-domain-containing protein n=1 Tax=Lasiosphaeria ovina TaxID=92902 RepID=A0AAE0KGC6_9PEZI|nr:glycosyltransferase WbsX-domain-containing protein [Lasiosphaeria ovina]